MAHATLPTLVPPPPADFPALTVKAQPEDFIVEELPLYEPCGTGTHTYLWIEKRGINTHDAVRMLAGILKKRAADCGVAGLKDSQAIARQWLSFEHVKDGLEALKQIDKPQLKVLHVSAHGNKLKMGHLRGNRFVITLRINSDAPAARECVMQRAAETFAVLSKKGLPNYFGAQRFGRGGGNVGLGQMLVRGERDAFETEFKARNGRASDRKLRNLLVNAFQSDLFNQVLARRMPEPGKLLPGDNACLHRNGALFHIESDAEAVREQPRADAFEISPSGPLFGPKMLEATGEPGRIEAEILAGAGVTRDDFGRDEAERQPGTRRSLRVALLEPPSAAITAAGVELRFALPSGSYATVVLRELTGRDDSANL